MSELPSMPTFEQAVESWKSRSMHWNDRYEKFAKSTVSHWKLSAGTLVYPEDHPSLLLPHIQRRVQSFYDAGGRIEYYTQGYMSPEQKEFFGRAYDDLDDNEKSYLKSHFDNIKNRSIQDEVAEGYRMVKGYIRGLANDAPGILHSNMTSKFGGTHVRQVLVAFTPDDKVSGACGVDYFSHDPDHIAKLNRQMLDRYKSDMDQYNIALDEHHRKLEEVQKDPWFVPGSTLPNEPRKPVEPTLYGRPSKRTGNGEFDFSDDWNAHPHIGSIKRITGTGSALHHALTTILAPLGLGVVSAYATTARTFHMNMGRRVDWEKGPTSSIWLPSDVKAIAGIKLDNPRIEKMSNVKEASFYPYSEGDDNPDEVSAYWTTVD